MAVLPTNFKSGDPLNHDVVNDAFGQVNTLVTNVATVSSDVNTTKASLTTTQTVANKNQSDLVAANQTIATQATAITTLQTGLTAAQQRLTVLENVTPPPAVPGKPTGLTAGTITTTSVALSWTAPTGTAATGYQTRRAAAGTGNWVNGPSTTAPTVAATVTSLTQGTNYDFTVVASNAAGPGGISDPITRRTLSSFTPSPAWTAIPPASTITMDDGGLVTVVGGVVMLNGSPMGTTAQVILVVKSDTGRIYQENSFLDWWYWDPTQAQPWVFTSDPRATPPVSGVPAPASAVGYNTRTLGPLVILSGAGQNWFQANNITTNPDGSVTLHGGNSGFNYDAVTGDGHSFGTAFGGGLYIEMDASWTGNYNASGGWPSYWSNAVESRQIAAAPNWPAGIADGGGYDAIEWDILETFSDGWGQTIWDWSNGAIGNRYGAVAGAWNAVGGVHSGPTDGRRKKVGALWIPATSTTQGRAEIYRDGVLLPEQTIRWDLWNSSVGLPLVNGHTAGAIMDFQHLNFIMGTGPNNPMTVYTMEIWQRNGSGNLPPT